jgi:hypothetical protein
VSGKVEAQLDVKIPVSQPNTFCAYNCFDNTYKGWRTLYTMDIRVIRMMTSLPADPAYVKYRTPDVSHTDDNAYYSTPSTQLYLKTVAMEYKKTRGQILSINDMSLPKGGLFDIYNTWESPHTLHRAGTSVDINTTDTCTSEEDKNFNDKLKKAANKIIPPLSNKEWVVTDKDKAVRSGPFLCEVGDKFHLDFDSHTIDVSK